MRNIRFGGFSIDIHRLRKIKRKLGLVQRRTTPIYNGAPQLILKGLLPHRSVKMRELWPPGWPSSPEPDYSTLNEDYIRKFVRDLANVCTYEFDVEGNINRPDLGLDKWDYEQNPETAVALRHQLIEIILSERTDLDIGLYGIPDSTVIRKVIKDTEQNRETAQTMLNSVMDYQPTMALCNSIYITAYWRWQPNDYQMLPSWEAEIRLKIALSMAFYGRMPKAYHWHRGYNFGLSDPNPSYLAPGLFEKMTEFLVDQGVEIVFWSEQDDADCPIFVKYTLTRWKQ